MEKKVFVNIFKIIDQEHREVINGSSDLLNADLPSKVKEFLSPLIEELKVEKESLSMNEFVIACLELYKVHT